MALCLIVLIGAGCGTNEKEKEVAQQPSTASALCSESIKVSKVPAGDVLSLAQTAEPEAYDFVESSNAEIVPVNNGRTFAVWWQPEDFDPAEDLVIVSLHGHGGWATTDFQVWYPELEKRGYAFVGIQWWFGRSLEDIGYDEPGMIYQNIKEVLSAKGIPAGHIVFQGFSMGSARSYGVALYDNLCGEKYFGVSIANSGPWEDNYPLYKKVLAETYGSKPFAGTNWILFCGEKDDDEFGLGHVCDGLQDSYYRLTELGGSVDLFLRDPEGDHGSFMRNQENLTAGLDAAEEVLGFKE